jgi:DUF4097 and DUF4098 domain-containing protein YvlB
MRASLLGIIALLLITASPLAAQRRIDEHRPLAPDGAIRVYNLYGSVRVVGWSRDSVAVTGTTSLGERFFIGSGDRSMKVGVESDEAHTVRGSHLVLHVPERARVWVKTASAEIEVRDVRGGLDLSSVGASIRVFGSPRELNAETMDGQIAVTGMPAWLRAKTANGGITFQGTSEDVALSSVSGPLLVDAGAIARGRFETVTGNIEFRGSFDPRGSVTFETHSGAVDLRVPSDVAAEFDVTTIRGTIDNGLSRATPTAASDGRGRVLSFATRPGAAQVTIRSFKGPVTLRTAEPARH